MAGLRHWSELGSAGAEYKRSSDRPQEKWTGLMRGARGGQDSEKG